MITKKEKNRIIKSMTLGEEDREEIIYFLKIIDTPAYLRKDEENHFIMFNQFYKYSTIVNNIRENLKELEEEDNDKI